TFDCGNTAGASCKNYKCMTLDDALRNDGKKDGKTYTGNCGEPSKVCMATDQYADRMGWVDNKKFRFNIKNTCAIGKTINITVVNNDNVKNGIDHGKNVQYAYSDGQIKTGDFSFENNFRFEKWDKTNGIHREIKISVEETIYTEKDINGNQSVKRINYIPDIIIDIIPIDNTTTNVDINTGGC
ncbi:MAG TPA: hypothetical protein VK338_04180, partial [Candidatus Nitrosocosmicus sp.]|nr:hypothetical protein [Candidatus Nitrosocosmicus sp.]